MFTMRYALCPYIKQTGFVFKGLRAVFVDVELNEYQYLLFKSKTSL